MQASQYFPRMYKAKPDLFDHFQDSIRRYDDDDRGGA